MIIVTGANGFIGSALVWELNKTNFEKFANIVAVDSVPLEERPLPLKKRKISSFLHKDKLWDFLNLPSTIDQTTWIFHMGANSSTTETNWEHLYENNTLYTQRIFEWCAKHGKPLIYASSAATYGDGSLGFEDDLDSEQLKPLNLYGESKVVFDRWALRQSKTPPHWYGIKFFNVYGPNEYHKGSMASLVSKAYQQIRETGKLNLFKSYHPAYKDGEQMRDFIYVKDTTRWMIELTQKLPPSGIYNMGFGQARTWNDLAAAAFSALSIDKSIQYIEMPESLHQHYQYFTEAPMKKWLKAGMSTPQWPVEAGVTDYIKNYLIQPDSYL